MADPTPDPVPPTLTGWQYVVVECVKMLVPVVLAVWLSNRATDHAIEAGHKADAAHAVAAENSKLLTGRPPKD